MQLQFEATPLWFYILREADLMADGRHLVGVGARIAGQVILGLLQTDANSFVVAQPDLETDPSCAIQWPG
jgi:hypothetical protein